VSANEKQVGGTHYSTDGGLQHWDIVNIFKLDYFQGQITKYVMRWNKKNGVEDLRKAAHFLEKYIELQGADEKLPAWADPRKYTRLPEMPPGAVAAQDTDLGPIDSDANFKAEGWFGDGVVHYVCRGCGNIVYAKGLARARELHHCSKANT